MPVQRGRILVVGALVASFCVLPSWSVPPDDIVLRIFPGHLGFSPMNPGWPGGYVGIGPSQFVEQSFVATVAGKLLGIQIVPTRGTAGPGDTMALGLRSITAGRFLGSVSLPAAGFPAGDPGPLVDGAGPGFFDLSAFDILMTPGHLMVFDLTSGEGSGVCDTDTHLCAAGRAGESCLSDSDCDGSMAVRAGPDTYPDGDALVNGGFTFPSLDVAFKVVVQLPSSPADAVTLSWAGGSPPYDLHRSEDPETLLDPASILVATGDFSSRDLPPAGEVWYYGVRNRAQVNPYNLESWYGEPVTAGAIPGQTFTVVAGGHLLGIEVAALRDTVEAGDSLILDLFAADGTLLASAAVPASAFPPGGAGTLPDRMSYDVIGPGYFDLSSFEIIISPGEVLSFDLRPSFGPGVCDLMARLCTEGRVGLACFDHEQCDKMLRIGVSPSVYGGGNMTANGAAIPDADLAFKVVFRP